MNNLMCYDKQFPISGRELHERLDIETPYKQWFDRMIEYGFSSSKDFYTRMCESTGGRPAVEHALTLDMAKHICMIQRTPKGMEVRQYLINVESEWNKPEAVFARALKMADEKLKQLSDEVNLLSAANMQMRPKATYYDVILTCHNAMPINVIAKDYGKTAIWLNEWLHEAGVQYKQGGVWLLYAKYADCGYTCSRTNFQIRADGIHAKIHAFWTQKGRQFIYELLKQYGILPIKERSET